MADLLLDTDVFVDHIRGARQIAPGADAIHYSVITRCELFAGLREQEELVRELLAPFRELPVDAATAERAGRIRRDTDVLTPDALIAATAIENRLMLVSRNRSDYERVPRLPLHDPRAP